MCLFNKLCLWEVYFFVKKRMKNSGLNCLASVTCPEDPFCIDAPIAEIGLNLDLCGIHGG